MNDLTNKFQSNGIIQNWRRDRGYGQIKDILTGTYYLASLAGHHGPPFQAGVSLDGINVRFHVRSRYQPVDWICVNSNASENLPFTKQALLQEHEIVSNQTNSPLNEKVHEINSPEVSPKAQFSSDDLPTINTDLENETTPQTADKKALVHDIITLKREHGLTASESEELFNLLEEMRPLGFSQSKDLSEYIVKNNLGRKYPNISGVVRMEEHGREWNFPGGFHPRLYAIICNELQLNNQRSEAKAIGFTSFNIINSNGGLYFDELPREDYEFLTDLTEPY